MKLTDKQEEAWYLYAELESIRKVAKAMGVGYRATWQHIQGAKKKLQNEGADPGQLLKGTSRMVGPDGETKLVWYKGETEKQNFEDLAQTIVANLNSDIPRYKKTKKPKSSKEHKSFMNSYVFGDPHVNMYSFARETGSDWDVKIAVQRHTEGMLDLIENARPAHTGRFISLGDMFHSDSLKPYTLSGTQVDVDGRLSMAVDEVVDLVRACLDLMINKYQQVDVVFARGNHPPTIELLLAKIIRIAYEKEPRINVVDNTAKHIPLTFGKNFRLITHGDSLTHQKKADIAVGKFRHLHGAAAFTHVLSGHLHHHDIKELGGIESEIFQVLPTQDAWHVEHGFVTADQSACVIRYHELGGIIDRHYYNPRFYMG